MLTIALYLPLLIATDMHHAGWTVFAVVSILLALRARVLALLDWGLLLIFARLLAGLSFVRDAMQGLGLNQPSHPYMAAIAASQIVSNVPAAIALAEYSTDWRVIAFGVSVGGFEIMVGSPATLIALRMSRDSKAWLTFHMACHVLMLDTAQTRLCDERNLRISGMAHAGN